VCLFLADPETGDFVSSRSHNTAPARLRAAMAAWKEFHASGGAAGSLMPSLAARLRQSNGPSFPRIAGRVRIPSESSRVVLPESVAVGGRYCTGGQLRLFDLSNSTERAELTAALIGGAHKKTPSARKVAEGVDQKHGTHANVGLIDTTATELKTESTNRPLALE
jgi:hypothetical protein